MSAKTLDGWTVTLKGDFLMAKHAKYGTHLTNLSLAGATFESATRRPHSMSLAQVLADFAFLLEQAVAAGDRK
jgi:hypothetical protein